MKQLQIALDFTKEDKALEILEKTAEYVDIIECGTPLMVACGSNIIKKIKTLYPEKKIFADIKVVDGGGHVPESVLDAGADIVSVLGAAEFNTIQAAEEIIHRYGAQIMIDMILVKDIPGRVKKLEILSPDIWSVHVAYDIQGKNGVSVLDECKMLNEAKGLKAAAGGIRLETFEAACQTQADILIVGAGLCQVDDPAAVAKAMRTIMNRY